MADTGGAPVLEFVVFVVDWRKLKSIGALFDEAYTRFHFVAKGQGTASSEVLDMLGIGSAEKAVLLCLARKIVVPRLLTEAGRRLGFHMPGTGIGFSVPLAAVNAPVVKMYQESVDRESVEKSLSAKNAGKETEEEMEAKTQADCSLIVAVLNQGYSDEFMACAREAGAGGGTVINARGLARRGAVKFFGITVQDEKEIIIILSGKAKMTGIMEAVSRAYGVASKAEGLIFSLPVDHVTGIDLR